MPPRTRNPESDDLAVRALLVTPMTRTELYARALIQAGIPMSRARASVYRLLAVNRVAQYVLPGTDRGNPSVLLRLL